MSEFTNHDLGVHFGMGHAEYLNDEGLGYSSVKDLFLSPTEWWNDSRYNPMREEPMRDSLAYLRGAALHTNTLDGPRVYKRVYGQMPTLLTHPDHIDGTRELLAACVRLGLPTRYTLKEELVDRIRAKKRSGVKLLDTAIQRFNRSGKLAISPRDDARIKILYRMMQRSREELKVGPESLTIKDALRGALTELSVFWIDDAGIRQRARFDGIKPNFTLDLKSITQWKKNDFKKSLLREMILRGYLIQTAHYNEGRRALRQAVAEGRVFGGTKAQLAKLDRIAEADAWAWVSLFAKMDGAPQVRAIVIQPDSAQVIRATAQREEALANYIWHREFHGGVDKPWFDPETVWTPEDTDWPEFSVLGES